MSIKLIEAVFDKTQNLKASARLLLAMLADYADQDGYCYPAVSVLAKRMGMSDRGVRLLLAELCKANILIRHVQGGQKTRHGNTNLYRLNTDILGVNGNSGVKNDSGVNGSSGVNHSSVKGGTTVQGEPSYEPSINTPLPPKGESDTHPNFPSSPKNERQPEGGADIPRWLPPDAWRDFIEYRQELKKPLGRTASRLAIEKLDQLRRNGHDPVAVIQQTILNHWTRLLPIRERNENEAHQRPRKPSLTEQAEAATERGLRRIEAERKAAMAMGAHDGSVWMEVDDAERHPNRRTGPLEPHSANVVELHPVANRESDQTGIECDIAGQQRMAALAERFFNRGQDRSH